jgi:hypothetical protein
MRLVFSPRYGKGLFFLFMLLLSCNRNTEEIPLIPPATNPLTREFIGYGVVNESFIHVVREPRQNEASLGYLRKGSLVKIIERRALTNRGNVEIWVLVDAEYTGTPEGKIQGWLMENTLNVFDTESRALTASEAMTL